MRVPPRGSRLRAPWTVLALLGLSLLTATTTVAQGRRRAPVLALKVGTVHPVSGPAIENGVILMRGPRILAVGSADSVEIPEGARTIEYPEGHAYPGLIDPLSTAFAPSNLIGDRNVDAGTLVEPGLDPFDERSRELVRHGVTTAYVANRSSATWRGQGLVIRPGTNGFRPLSGERIPAVHYRISTGNQHPLQRAGTLANFGKEFDSIEGYEKAFEEYEKKKKEYDEAFEKYLDYHREKNGIEKPKPEETGEEKPGEGENKKPEAGSGEEKTGENPTPGSRRRGSRGRRGSRPGGRPSPGGEKPAEPSKEGGDKKPSGDGKKDDKAPKRPKAPKEPKKDDAKEAYKMLRDGEARLVVDARHPDEIRRAAEIARENELTDVVLEGASGLAACADDVAPYFTGVVLSDSTPLEASATLPEEAAGQSLPVVLEKAGIPVAFGSGSLQRAMHLPTIAAEAVGHGLSTDAALRALTLTPAKLLGVEDRVGSLDEGKLADVVVFSGPLFESRSRIIHVLSAGRTISLED